MKPPFLRIAALATSSLLTSCGPSAHEVELETSLRYERRTVAALTAKNLAQTERIQRLEAEAEASAQERVASSERWKKTGEELMTLRRLNLNLEEVVRTSAAAQTALAKQDEQAQAERSEVERRTALALAHRRSAWKTAQLPAITAAAETVRITVQQARREGAVARAAHVKEVRREEKVKADYQNPLESTVRYVTRERLETELVPFPDLIYIAGLNTVSDHEEKDVTLYPAGFHEPASASGTPRRLRQYALTPDRAADLLADQESF